jgi:serine/threonine protein kinase/tetratricopeptide (TPR) repeat protein
VRFADEEVTRLGPAEPNADAWFEPGQDPRVGPYRLIREIGRGGMGAVYLAVRDDDAFEKRVAIKILKRGMDTDSIVRRFRNERQILAGLDHPNIAVLLDGGTTSDGRPFFVMEFVEGVQIVAYCEVRRLDTTKRLELFRQVCSAVQYAHQNLVVHRDIKPANVLVTPDGTPKLLDFGIAKLLNAELAHQTLVPTVPGLALMTPEYASPEQVRGDNVTTATDVYSLGVLLYELLTGRRPYRLTSRVPSEIARVICEAVPARPSTAITDIATAVANEALTISDPSGSPTEVPSGGRSRPVDTERLRRRLAGDLDNIVLKALNKEPARRYASVDQFSEDVRRHLAGLPVIARKDTLGYRTAKFVARNRGAVVAGVSILIALVAGIIGTAWQARVARIERVRAEQRFDDVRQLANSFLFELHDAIRDLPGSTPARQLVVAKGREYLDKLSRDAANRDDLKRELAAAYIKVGDVQGRPLNPNLGDTPGALASYKKAVAIYESLGVAASSHPALRQEAATAYLRVSDVLSVMGDTAQALSMAQKALDFQRGIASDRTASDDARRELVVGYSRVGDLRSASGDTNGALEYRRIALALMETLAAVEPNDTNNLRQLGVAYHKLANSLGNPNYPNVGDYEGALQQIEKCVATFERAVALYPTNAMFRRNLAVAHSNMADILLALKRSDEALEHEQRAATTFQAQADEDPKNAAAQNDLAITFFKMAGMLDERGRTREALRQYEQALAVHQRLAAADPENAALKLEVASDYSALATTQAKLGNRGPALAHHMRAVTTSRELSTANLGNVELRVTIALALIERGDTYARFARRPGTPTRTADLAAAERDYTEAVDILTKLQEDGRIAGSDIETLEKAKRELTRIRGEKQIC